MGPKVECLTNAIKYIKKETNEYEHADNEFIALPAVSDLENQSIQEVDVDNDLNILTIEYTANGEDRLDLLELLPDPVQISPEKGNNDEGNNDEDNIIYRIRENGTVNGKTVIEDVNHSHNHGPDYAHQTKKDINEELKRLAVKCINLKTAELVDRIIKEIEHVKLINFFRGDVIIQKARHFIFFTDEQLVYMAKAHNWYIDGTFKIVKKPIKQLVTIHVVLVYLGSKRFSIPVCFILMTHRRKCDYIMVLDFIRRKCNQYLDEYNLCNNLLRIMADF